MLRRVGPTPAEQPVSRGKVRRGGMGGRTRVQNRMLRVAAAIAALGFVAACEAPTPPAVNGGAPDVAAPSPNAPQQAPVAKREARQIVVEPGRSVSRIAAKHGVSPRAIIDANKPTPTSKIKTRQQLLPPRAR